MVIALTYVLTTCMELIEYANDSKCRVLLRTRKQSCGKGNVFTPVCDSVHGGVHPLGIHPPPGQTPLWADTPWADTSLDRHPLGRHRP